MADMKKLLEAMDKIPVANPKQKPGAQLRGTDPKGPPGGKLVGSCESDESAEDEKPLEEELAEGFAKFVAENEYADDDIRNPGYREDDLENAEYVIDTEDGSGEVFRISGYEPGCRRCRIEDKDGRGWYISPHRLQPVEDGARIARYFPDDDEELDESSVSDFERQSVYSVMINNGPDVDMYSPKFTRIVNKIKASGIDLRNKAAIYAWLEDAGYFGRKSDSLRGSADKFYEASSDNKDWYDDYKEWQQAALQDGCGFRKTGPTHIVAYNWEDKTCGEWEDDEGWMTSSYTAETIDETLDTSDLDQDTLESYWLAAARAGKEELAARLGSAISKKFGHFAFQQLCGSAGLCESDQTGHVKLVNKGRKDWGAKMQKMIDKKNADAESSRNAARVHAGGVKAIPKTKVDELSKKTLQSYRAKAQNSVDKTAKALRSAPQAKDVDTGKLKNRADGIKTASRKLSSESVSEGPINWDAYAKAQAYKNRGNMTKDEYRDAQARQKRAEIAQAKLLNPSKPATPKVDLDAVWQNIQRVVGNTFPDGDPMDWLAEKYPRYAAIGQLGVLMDKATRHAKAGKSFYDYLARMWHDVAQDAMADARNGHVDEYSPFYTVDGGKITPQPNPWGTVKEGLGESYWNAALAAAEKSRKEREGKPFEKNPASHDKDGVYKGDKDLAGNPVNKKKVSEDVIEITWETLGEDLSVLNKIAIFEEYAIRGNLFESNDENLKSYFVSLFDMSDAPTKGQKYIVVPLTLLKNKLMQLANPKYMEFLGRGKDGLVFRSSTGEQTYPSKLMREISVSNAFTFSNVKSYDKFRNIIQLKFDFDLPDVSITNEVKHFRTAYGWAGGRNEKTGGVHKHPEQIKKDKQEKKATPPVKEENEAASPVSITPAGDNTFKISVAATSGPDVKLIQRLAYRMSDMPRKFPKVTTKSGIVLNSSNMHKFKSNAIIVTGDEAAVKDFVGLMTKSHSNSLKKDAAYKAKAPERKKAAAAYNAKQQKDRRAAQDAKLGKGIYQRVKIGQVGGDDGYQYNVFVDGRSIMNGLTRSQAEYEADRQRMKLSKNAVAGAMGFQGQVEEDWPESTPIEKLVQHDKEDAVDRRRAVAVDESSDQVRDGDIVEFKKGPYFRPGYYRVDMDAVGASPERLWVGDLRSAAGWYVPAEDINVVCKSDEVDTTAFHNSHDVQDYLEGDWELDEGGNRRLPTGRLRNHPWVGKHAKVAGGPVGVVTSVSREHTFSQMVPYITLVNIQYPDGTEEEYRKNHVRLAPAPKEPQDFDDRSHEIAGEPEELTEDPNGTKGYVKLILPASMKDQAEEVCDKLGLPIDHICPSKQVARGLDIFFYNKYGASMDHLSDVLKNWLHYNGWLRLYSINDEELKEYGPVGSNSNITNRVQQNMFPTPPQTNAPTAQNQEMQTQGSATTQQQQAQAGVTSQGSTGTTSSGSAPLPPTTAQSTNPNNNSAAGKTPQQVAQNLALGKIAKAVQTNPNMPKDFQTMLQALRDLDKPQ